MFQWLTNPNLFIGGAILAVFAIVPCLALLYAVDPRSIRKAAGSLQGLGGTLLSVLIFGIILAIMLAYIGASSNLKFYGWLFGGAVLLAYKLVAFIYLPHLLALIFPKMGAVALAAYREAWRQPTFWLITIAGFAATWLAAVMPYFTFGDDFRMFKHISYDIIMISTLIFGTLVTSFAIAEEIEGRTAITVMSKPISRRSFLLGKFLGVLMASGAMASILTGNTCASLSAMREFDQINLDRSIDPLAEQMKTRLVPEAKVMPSGPAREFSEGIARWWAEEFSNSLGTMLIFGQVMILIAIATALATRLPFVVNLTVVLFIYLFGNLAPVIVRVSQNPTGEGSQTGVKLIGFLAQMFDTLLPALEFFNMGPAIIRDTPLQIWSFTWYVLTVLGYSIIYTLIALFVGLLLFEDRDLA